jgi:HAE1 family hydrophobic/amphiphilic exporter-1
LSFLTTLALRRKPVTIMVMGLLLAVGLYSYDSLHQELFPEISFAIVYVITPYQQGDPNTVASEVTEKIENVIIGMADLDKITSVSSSSVSSITATFTTGADTEKAEEEIRANVGALDLPDDALNPIVVRVTSDIFPVMWLSVSGDRDIPSLQQVIDDEILPQLEAVDGVYEVDVQGGVHERVSIIVDPARLEEYNLGINDVANSVQANSIDLSGGDFSRNGRSAVIRTYSGYGDLDSIRNVPVGYIPPTATGGQAGNSRDATPILLWQVAEVVIDTPESQNLSRTNGQASVSLRITREPDVNTIELSQQLLAVIDAITVPDDVRVEILYNDGPELEKQLSKVMRQGGQGFVIAVAAIFIFLLQFRPSAWRGVLNTLRPTLIIAVSIPLSVMMTILVMAIFDWTLNFMSLAGLAIAVGRIVDDSIVVLENTYRHVQAGEPRASAAVRGAREVGAAILASTLTTVAVFLPLAFIPGIVGEFFLPFAQTVCVSLLGSTFIALTAVPVLGSVLLRQGDMADEADSENTDTWLQRIYTPILTWTLRHRLITVFGCVGVVAASLPLLLVLPITLFSSGDPESMRIDITMPESTDVGAMFTEVSAVESILEGYREEGHITAYQVTMGSTSQDFGPSLGESGYDVAGFFIALSDDLPTDFIEELRGSLPEKEGVEFQLFVETAGPPQSGLEVAVTGPNFPDVQAVARDLVDWITPVEGVVNLKTNINDAQEELTFQVDLTEAGRYGLSSQDVASQVRTWTYGMDVSDVNLNGESYDLVVRGPGEMLDDIKDLQGLAIGGPLGTVPLGAISDVKSTVGPSIVTRYDGDRSVTITGEFEGQDTQAISAGINQIITQADLPPGVSVVQGGFASDIEEQFANVYLAMIIGVSLVYLVMVATLGSLRDPFIVVLSMPLAVVGALVALTLTGRALSLSSLMGFLFLIGIVVTNAIVLITFVNQLREEGRDVLDAMIVAGRTRLRPILMTAFTTIFALFPLAFSNTSGFVGAELATVVIGGLVSSTFLTLVAVPVTYMLMHESIPSLWARASGAVSGRRTPPASSPPASPLDSAAV